MASGRRTRGVAWRGGRMIDLESNFKFWREKMNVVSRYDLVL